MICSVFQPSRIVKGRRVRHRLWYGRLRLERDGRVETIPLQVTDKRVAQQKLNAIAKERQLVAAGLAVPSELRTAAGRPLSVLIAGFLDDLRARGRTHGTVKRYRNLLRTLCKGCRWEWLGQVSAAAFMSWRAQREDGPHYANDILGAMRTFLTWLERQGYVGANRLRNVGSVQNHSMGQFRRALSADEIARLLAAAPPSRAWVYLFIVYTGLRRYELNRLNWGHFHLDVPRPYVELEAQNTKSKRAACQPLRPEVVAALRAQRPVDAGSGDWVFRGKVPMPAKLRADLAAAGIPYVDERGRRVDVHALRTTFGTMLSVAGVPPRVAMELMRHSDLKLTMRIYTDAGHLPLAEDVERLPSFSVPVDAQINAQIRSQIAVGGSVGVSDAVGERRGLANGQSAEIVPFSPAESQPNVAGRHR